MNSSLSHPIDLILPLLKKVRRKSVDRWSACCPAHEDNSPSLSITRYADDGVGLRCFAGCSTWQIVNSVGLNASDLFPHSEGYYPSGKQKNPRRVDQRLVSQKLVSHEVISILKEDLQAVMIGAALLAQGETLTADDLDRLGSAALRVYLFITPTL